MIRRLIERDAVQALDFGRGDDAYKQLWVAARRQRIGLVVADVRHPGGITTVLRQNLGKFARWLRVGARLG
ncbi:hypothetical protein [Falsiroseomonas oryzae]|uniref:hypothetical protein n=1 Tax=Falsiroseomonas oryzae TaxID=2766473 RepID=UPI0022EAF659|nr:hypothetical protein [Roseomonas sp. MO-31]